MSLLLALLLVVHGGIHVGYLCARGVWPFPAGDPWLVTALGASAGTVSLVISALVVVTFLAFLLAAVAAAGILPPSRFFAPIAAFASAASAIVLVVLVTPGTLPGLAMDALLLWATVVRGWHPTPFFGRPRAGHGHVERALDAR